MTIIMIFYQSLYYTKIDIISISIDTKTCVTENPENILRFLLQTRVLKNPSIIETNNVQCTE